MDKFSSEAFCDFLEDEAWGSGAHQSDVSRLRVEASGGDESLFECFCEIESRVLPDIRDRSGGVEEHRSAVGSHRDSWTDHLVFEVSRKECQGGFFGVFGEPSRAPVVVTRVWFGVKAHYSRIEMSDRGRIDFDVQRAVVPMP